MLVPVYKKLTYPQLRSFYESARLENITAAAEFLEVAQPTVWKQVRALEKQLNTQLLVSNGRGCTLTAEGEVLLRLVTPFVGGVENLVEQFHSEVKNAIRKLIVAVSPRTAEEELPLCLPLLDDRMPRTQLTLLQVTDIHTLEAVTSGMADLALTTMHEENDDSPLIFEPVYVLEPILLLPKGHPLASKRRIQVRDLCAYPFLNRSGTYPDQVVDSILEQAGVYSNPERRLELNYASTIHRYVKLGYGVGLVGRVPGAQPYKDVVERSMSEEFNTCFHGAVAYRRKKVKDPLIDVFVQVVKEVFDCA